VKLPRTSRLTCDSNRLLSWLSKNQARHTSSLSSRTPTWLLSTPSESPSSPETLLLPDVSVVSEEPKRISIHITKGKFKREKGIEASITKRSKTITHTPLFSRQSSSSPLPRCFPHRSYILLRLPRFSMYHSSHAHYPRLQFY
jgi:hypothetical protein